MPVAARWGRTMERRWAEAGRDEWRCGHSDTRRPAADRDHERRVRGTVARRVHSQLLCSPYHPLLLRMWFSWALLCVSLLAVLAEAADLYKALER